MRNAIIAFAVAGLAAAQTSTSSVAATGTSATVSAASATSTSGCGTQVDAIIASCLGTENAQLQACAANDWDCLCTQSTNVLTCYNNCPSDPNAFAAQQQNTAYCNAAKAYGSTSSSATASATASGASTVASSGSATGSGSQSVFSGFATGTTSGGASATGSSSQSTSSSGAGNIYAPAGGFAAVLGLAALL